MDTNPYAPPHSAVGDVTQEEEILRSCFRIAKGVAINAAMFGALVICAAVAVYIRRAPQGTLFAGFVFLTLYGVLAIVAAIGLYRQQRWAAILWLVQSALILLIPLFRARFAQTAEFVLVAILVLQCIASMAGIWAVGRRRTIIAKA